LSKIILYSEVKDGARSRSCQKKRYVYKDVMKDSKH